MNPYLPYRQAQKTAERRPEYSRLLDLLERALREMQIEFEKFFNGAEAVPPEELRTRLQERFRELRSASGMSSVEQFRLGSLEARFNSYSEMFGRRLREREEGRSQRASPMRTPDLPRFDVRQGVVLGGESLDSEGVEALYVGLLKAPNAPNFDLDSFSQYLQRQVHQLRLKTGCGQVQFRLEDDAGKVRLKAKPIRG